MTVSQLIDILKTLNQDEVVYCLAESIDGYLEFSEVQTVGPTYNEWADRSEIVIA